MVRGRRMSGFYLMHRGWQGNPVFRNEAFSRRDAFVWLIEEAAFRPVRIYAGRSEISLSRGQLSHSLRHIASAWRWDLARVSRFIASMTKAKIIDTQTDTGQTVITICNYEKYQVSEKQPDTPNDTGSRQQRDGGDTKKNEGNKGNERKGEEEDASAKPSLDLDQIVSAWNTMAGSCPAKSWATLTEKRKTALRERIKDYGRDALIEAIGIIPTKPWLMGQNSRKWSADPDWFIRPDSIAKLNEGKYDHGQSANQNGRSAAGPTAESSIFAARRRLGIDQ